MAQADYRSGGTSAPHPDIPKTGNDVALLTRDEFDRNVWCVLGLPVDIATIDSAVGDIAMAAQGRRRLSFVTPNVNWLVRSWREAGVRREILDADLSLIDGAPLLFFARLLGAPAPSRAAGSDLFDALRRRPGYGGRKLKVYFFGGREGAAEAAARAIEDENGPLEAVGWRNPGFGDVEAMSADEHIDHINAADPDFVVVSLGAAKGQAWIDANKARLNAPVTAHLGAVVDFTAGGIVRAPEWMRNAGLEWLWRIKEEPSLWRRYYKDGVALAGLVLRRLVTQLGAAQTIDASAAGEASFLPAGLPASGLPALGGGLSTVRLVGALGRGNIKSVREAFRKAAAAGADVRLDFSGLEAFDRAFLGQVLMLEKALCRQGLHLFVDGADRAQRRLLRANAMRYSQSGTNTQETPVHATRGEYGGGVA